MPFSLGWINTQLAKLLFLPGTTGRRPCLQSNLEGIRTMAIQITELSELSPMRHSKIKDPVCKEVATLMRELNKGWVSKKIPYYRCLTLCPRISLFQL